MTPTRITSAIGSSLGTLGNIALTWEGEAAKIAGRFGMAGQLVAGFLELLIPQAEQPPPVTKQDLDQALNDLKKGIIDAIWQARADTVKADVDGFNDDFQRKWEDLTKAKLETGKDAQGQPVLLPVFDLEDALTPITVKVSDGYYYPAGTSALTLDTYRHDVEDASFTTLPPDELAQKEILTLQLYILIGTLQVAYYHASIAWRWGQEMLLANQVISYQKDHAAWTAQCLATPAYAKKHPEEDLFNPYPELKAKVTQKADFAANYKQPEWGAWSTEAGSPVEQLQNAVDVLLNYSVNGAPASATKAAQPGLYPKLRKRWDALETAVAASDFAATAGKQSCIVMGNAMALGFQRASAWSKAVAGNYLQNLEEADVLSFGKALDAWRTIRASVSFHYYTTKADGETFSSVATLQYTDATMGAKISQYNPGVSDPLPKGTPLKIFDKAWLPYVDLKDELWPRATSSQST